MPAGQSTQPKIKNKQNRRVGFLAGNRTGNGEICIARAAILELRHVPVHLVVPKQSVAYDALWQDVVGAFEVLLQKTTGSYAGVVPPRSTVCIDENNPGSKRSAQPITEALFV